MFKYKIDPVYQSSGNLYNCLLGIHPFPVFRISHCHCRIGSFRIAIQALLLTDTGAWSDDVPLYLPYRYFHHLNGTWVPDRWKKPDDPHSWNALYRQVQLSGWLLCNPYSWNRNQKTYRLLEWCFPGYFTDGACFLQQHLAQTNELFQCSSKVFLPYSVESSRECSQVKKRFDQQPVEHRVNSSGISTPWKRRNAISAGELKLQWIFHPGSSVSY